MTGISKPRRAFAFLALLIGATIATVFLATSERPPGELEWLSAPPAQGRPRLAFLGRWMGPVKAQLQRVKQRFTGPSALVTLDSTVIEIDPAALPQNWTAGARGFTNGAGTRALVIDKGESLQKQLLLSGGKEVSRPRVAFGDAQFAQMAITENVMLGRSTNARTITVGSWLDVGARVKPHAVDLTCFFTSTECAVPEAARKSEAPVPEPTPVRTNAFFGARVQVPEGGSAFLFSSATNRNGRVMGIILKPTVWRPARK